jgi:tetratricopeptide (TPR) repeat protein
MLFLESSIKNSVYLKDFPRNHMDKVNFPLDEEDINLQYLYNIGVSHEKRCNLLDAIFYFDKVLDVKPNHVDALIRKGNVLGKLGKYEQAITCYDITLKIKPYHMICILNKGLALHCLGRYNQALTCYDKILEMTPDNADTLYHKSCTKALQKDMDMTLILLEKSIILDPRYAEKASQDKDFDSFRDNIRFKALIV